MSRIFPLGLLLRPKQNDPRPLIFVRESIPPVAEVAVRLALPEVRVVFAHAEERRVA